MSAAAPWSVKGIDPKAREVAKDLARRSGLTLGEWLNAMIMEDDDDVAVPLPRRHHAAQTFERRGRSRRLDDAYSGGDDLLQRLAAAVDSLAGRLEAAEQRSAVAITGIDQAVSGLVRRLDGADAEGRTWGRRIDDISEELKEGHRRLRRFEQDMGPQTTERFGKVETSVQALTSRLYEIEERQRAAIGEVRQRLDVAEKGTGSDLLAQVTARLDQAQGRTADALRAMEQSFAGLDQRIRAAEGRVEPEGSREVARFEKLAETLARQVDANRDEMMRRLDTAAAEGRMERIERAVLAMGEQVQAAERRSAQAVEAMGREVLRIAQNLDGRLRTNETEGARRLEQVAEGLSRKVEQDVARAMDSVDHRIARAGDGHAAAIEKLGAEIGRISERLSDRIAQTERRSNQALQDIGERLDRASEKFDQRYDRASGELSERMRLSEERTAQLLAEARDKVDQRAGRSNPEPDWRAAAFPEDSFAQPDPWAGVAADPEPAYADDGYVDPAFPRADFQPEPEAAPEPRTVAEPAHVSRIVADPAPAIEVHAPTPFGQAAPSISPSDFIDDLVDAAQPEPAAPFGQVAAAPVAAPFGGFGGADVQDALDATDPDTQVDDDFSGDTEFVQTRGPTHARSASTRDTIEAARAAMAAAEAPQGAPSRSGFGLSLKRGGKSKLQERLDKQAKRGNGTVGKALASSVLAATLVGGAVYGYNQLINDPSIGPGTTGPDATLAPALTTAPAVNAEAETLLTQGEQALATGQDGAIDTITRAAEMGYAPAQARLAAINEAGEGGVSVNMPEARRWTERAARGGDVHSMFVLGMYNYKGDGGPKDVAEGLSWLRQAAERGHIDAQFNLAALNEAGTEGLSPNPGEALKWFLIAASLGDENAQVEADRLAKTVSSEVLGRAQTQAEAFQAPAA